MSHPPVTVTEAVTRKVGHCPVCGEDNRPLKTPKICQKCYQRKRRGTATVLQRATKATERIEALAQYAQEAKQILEEALPQAARDLSLASAMAALKGDHRPAQALLEGVPVGPNGEGRLLEPKAQKSSASPSVGLAIKIELPGGLGGCRQLPSPVIDAE
jgi:hypothetical protein